MAITNWGLSPIPFLPGFELSRRFYQQAVQPILAKRFPGLRHTAALLGSGSDVLGFDTPMSRDHHWGPRLVLFLSEAELAGQQAPIQDALRQELPLSFLGYPTNFEASPHDGVPVMAAVEQGPVDPLIDFKTVPGFIQTELGWDPRQPLVPADWLTFPQQRLLEVTAGACFMTTCSLKPSVGVWPIIQRTSGCTCWRASGCVSPRRSLLWGAPAIWAMHWARG
jgi:hypothetical protein